MDEKPDGDKTWEELFPDIDQNTPIRRRRFNISRLIAFALVILTGLYFFPNLNGLLDLMHYKNLHLFDQGPSVPVERNQSPGVSRLAPLPTGQWRYADTSAQEQLLFRALVYASPKPVIRILDSLDQQTVVKFETPDCNKNYSSHQYSCAIRAGDKFIIELNPLQVSNNPSGRFLLLHEIGHLVDYKKFNGQAYAHFKNAFERSPAYQNCFRYENGCAAEAEIFADQFAYYATSYNQNFTFYKTPQLLSDADFEKILDS